MQKPKRGEYKVVLLGEGRVGKTSLLSRFINNTFDENEQSTTQATMYSAADVPLPSSVGPSSSTAAGGPGSVKLAIWDTAGQERFHALAPIYYRNAAGAMLVYDVGDADSLRRVETWVKELRTVSGDSIQLVVCGNKCDRPASEQEVLPEEALAVAAGLGAQHLFTSAKTGMNVTEAFSEMAACVHREATDRCSKARGHRSSAAAGGVGEGGGVSASAGGAYEAPGRRRRHRGGAAVDDEGAGDLFLDHGGEVGVWGGGGDGTRASADGDAFGGDLRPSGTTRPLTLGDLQPKEERGSRHSSGDAGGGCC